MKHNFYIIFFIALIITVMNSGFGHSEPNPLKDYIDEFTLIHKKLYTCTPIKGKIATNSILGKIDGRCHYQVSIHYYKPENQEEIRKYDCKFPMDIAKEYADGELERIEVGYKSKAIRSHEIFRDPQYCNVETTSNQN